MSPNYLKAVQASPVIRNIAKEQFPSFSKYKIAGVMQNQLYWFSDAISFNVPFIIMHTYTSVTINEKLFVSVQGAARKIFHEYLEFCDQSGTS